MRYPLFRRSLPQPRLTWLLAASFLAAPVAGQTAPPTFPRWPDHWHRRADAHYRRPMRARLIAPLSMVTVNAAGLPAT